MATPPVVIGPSLRGTLATYLPTWLGNVPGLRNLFNLLWTVALQGDMLREIAWEGQLATYPGVGTPSALPLLGASRGLVQGPAETDASFATRLIAWLATNQLRGQAAGIVGQVQAYLVGQGSLGAGVLPIVSFVDRAGNMTTANADTSITQSQVTWNWDEIGGWTDNVGYHPDVVVDSWWSDGWLIIEDPFTHYNDFSDPNWLAAWNSGDQTVDSLCSQEVVTGLQAIVDAWKGAHVFIRCIVWYDGDPSTFTPTNPGWYGNWSSNQGGEQSAQRDSDWGYWQPLQGT